MSAKSIVAANAANCAYKISQIWTQMQDQFVFNNKRTIRRLFCSHILAKSGI